MYVSQKLLTMNNYVGRVISINKVCVTVLYEKDNSTEEFKQHQFSSVQYMIKQYNNRYGEPK